MEKKEKEEKGKSKELLVGGESIAREVIETAETDIKILLAAVATVAGNAIKMVGLDGTSTHVLYQLLELKWHGALVKKFQHFCTLHCLPLVGGIVSLVGGVILICKGAYDLYSIVNKQAMFRRVKDKINREVGPLLNKMHFILNNLLRESGVERAQKMQFVLYQTCNEYETLMLDLEKQLLDIRKGLTTSKWAVAATVVGLVSGMASIATSLFFFLGPASIVPAILYATGGGLTICGSFLTAGSQVSKYMLKNTVEQAMKNVQPTLFRTLKGLLSHRNINFLEYLRQVQDLSQKFGAVLNENLLSETVEGQIAKIDRTRYCKDCPGQSTPQLVFFGPEFKTVPLWCGYCGARYVQTESIEIHRSMENVSILIATNPPASPSPISSSPLL